MSKYYLAYGSNLNKEQMKHRCPDAKVFGTSYLDQFKLVFRGNSKGCGVLNIEPCKRGRIPVGIWEITPSDEKALDVYEGYPRFYRKEFFDVEVDGKVITAMAYVMNEGHDIATPSYYYYHVVSKGYKDFKFRYNALRKAMELSVDTCMN